MSAAYSFIEPAKQVNRIPIVGPLRMRYLGYWRGRYEHRTPDYQVRRFHGGRSITFGADVRPQVVVTDAEVTARLGCTVVVDATRVVKDGREIMTLPPGARFVNVSYMHGVLSVRSIGSPSEPSVVRVPD